MFYNHIHSASTSFIELQGSKIISETNNWLTNIQLKIVLIMLKAIHKHVNKN